MPHRSPPPLTLDLFDDQPSPLPSEERLGAQALLLRGFAPAFVDELLPALAAVEAAAPFRIMLTPGGQAMSVALTNCGELGWISDRRGYRDGYRHDHGYRDHGRGHGRKHKHRRHWDD